MGIEKVLDISTSHISPDTAQLLDMDGGDYLRAPFRFAVHTYGYVIWVPGEEVLSEQNFKKIPEMEAIIRYAIKKECMLINLDADAPVDPELKKFDWSV